MGKTAGTGSGNAGVSGKIDDARQAKAEFDKDGNVMRTTDWEFDFSALPNWNNRDSIAYVYDKFLEIPQNDALCCIYSIAEVSMCTYLGFLAILKNKENPSLFLNVAHGFNFLSRIDTNAKGSLIFLRPYLYDKKSSRVKMPILIIDIERNVFSYFLDQNADPYGTIVELENNVFRIMASSDRQKQDKCFAISDRNLKWHALAEIGSLPQQIQRDAEQ